MLWIPVGGGRFAFLWVIEYDAEKDFFPDVLSLRVPVLMRFSGEPFHGFLGLRDYSAIRLENPGKNWKALRGP